MPKTLKSNVFDVFTPRVDQPAEIQAYPIGGLNKGVYRYNTDNHYVITEQSHAVK